MITKINDLKVDEKGTFTLMVLGVSERKTRAGKPFLVLELFDGMTTIVGNYWDWKGPNKPARELVVDVHATVAEWQGVKQLNIAGVNTNKDVPKEAFAPSSGLNIDYIYNFALDMVVAMKDKDLKTICYDLLIQLKPLWLRVPGAVKVHHAYVGGTLVHSYNVALLAKGLAELVPEANVDLCVAGALLHDLGKLYTYNVNVAAIEMTQMGMLHEHTFIGANFICNFADEHSEVNTDDETVFAKIELLKHIVLSHHGKLEYGAAVQPLCIEAMIVNHADGIDSAVEQIRDASKNATEVFTDRIWALGNKPHITPEYVKHIFTAE